MFDKKEYKRKWDKETYQRQRKEVITLLGGKCVKCGSIDKLEIDHINPKTKTITFTRLYKSIKEKFYEELKKCQLLCKSCHSYKSIFDRGTKVAKGTHGTLSAYKYCHCELCKKAHDGYMKKWKKNKKRITINGKRTWIENTLIA